MVVKRMVTADWRFVLRSDHLTSSMTSMYTVKVQCVDFFLTA